MPYYDSVAVKYHNATGRRGGPLKELALNDVILRRIPAVEGRTILELGAGNGYFGPLLLRRFSGQMPLRLVITDQSGKMLEIAQRCLRASAAEYRRLDVRAAYPFPTESFDLVLATMVMNEVGDRGYQKALAECHRVLKPDGQLLMTVTHPAFVCSLSERGQLRRTPPGPCTMPGKSSLRLPVVRRTVQAYATCLERSRFEFELEDVYAPEEALNQRPGLRKAGGVPIALVFDCRKVGQHERS